jgi:hypothetical protein
MKKLNKIGCSTAEVMLLIIIIGTFISISSVMVLTANRDFKNRNRLNDLTRINQAINDFLNNGGYFTINVDSHNDWAVAALTAKDENENSLDKDNWTNYDKTGNKPSFYLPGGDYPIDPIGGYYLIHITESKSNKYILKACKDANNYREEQDCLTLN